MIKEPPGRLGAAALVLAISAMCSTPLLIGLHANSKAEPVFNEIDTDNDGALSDREIGEYLGGSSPDDQESDLRLLRASAKYAPAARLIDEKKYGAYAEQERSRANGNSTNEILMQTVPKALELLDD